MVAQKPLMLRVCDFEARVVLCCVAVTDVNTCGQCGAEAGLLMLYHIQHKGSPFHLLKSAGSPVLWMKKLTHCLLVTTESTLLLK